MYSLIARIPEIAKYFPRLIGYKASGKTRILFIEYLKELSWGGPWNFNTVRSIYDALDDVYNVLLDKNISLEISNLSKELRNEL